MHEVFHFGEQGGGEESGSGDGVGSDSLVDFGEDGEEGGGGVGDGHEVLGGAFEVGGREGEVGVIRPAVGEEFDFADGVF